MPKIMLYIKSQRTCYISDYLWERTCYISDYFWERTCYISNYFWQRLCDILDYKDILNHRNNVTYHITKAILYVRL